jgi:hypothetical protein
VRSIPVHAHDTLAFLWDHFDKLKIPREDEERDVQEAAWKAVFPEFRELSPSKWEEGKPQGQEEGHGVVAISNVLSDVADSLDEHLYALEWPDWWIVSWWRWYGDESDRMIRTVLQDTRRLLELARLALDLGIPVRCFRHGPAQTTPVAGYPLRPLSARPAEYVRPPVPARTPVRFATLAFLTTVNRESLVFYLEGGPNNPGLLFTADSDLRGINVQHVRPWDVVTAPHHGSANNKAAYLKIVQPVVWVRSDGYSKRRPCGEYLSVSGRRFCTLCRNSDSPKQAVRLYTRRGQWVRLRTRPCHCR